RDTRANSDWSPDVCSSDLTYTTAVFDQVAEAGTGMQEAAAGAGELKDGIRKAGEGNETVTANLEKLADSVLTFQNGAETLEKGRSEERRVGREGEAQCTGT